MKNKFYVGCRSFVVFFLLTYSVTSNADVWGKIKKNATSVIKAPQRAVESKRKDVKKLQKSISGKTGQHAINVCKINPHACK